jgi:hypothetical protein
MAISWNLDTTDSIDFDEFLEYFKAQGKDLLNSDLDDSALMMRRLVNNREFLTDRLNQQLTNLKTFQTANLYTPQVFLVHTESSFYIRANIWEPLKHRPGESVFFYDVPHDHNFTFLTAGYYGSGYRTRIYDYDHAKVIGYVGEPVELRFLEETTLPHGKVMLFRESIDIHTQMPPADLSISINVMKRYGQHPPDQYCFELARGEVLRKLDKLHSGIVIRLARALGNENTVDVLSNIMITHRCRRTRLQAFEAVASRKGNQIWERALADKDRLVRRVAEQNLGGSSILVAPESYAERAIDRAPGTEVSGQHISRDPRGHLGK